MIKEVLSDFKLELKLGLSVQSNLHTSCFLRERFKSRFKNAFAYFWEFQKFTFSKCAKEKSDMKRFNFRKLNNVMS
jgi:hypothetical protein